MVLREPSTVCDYGFVGCRDFRAFFLPSGVPHDPIDFEVEGPKVLGGAVLFLARRQSKWRVPRVERATKVPTLPSRDAGL